MKFQIPKEKLAWALQKAEKVTGKNLALPVLGCVLLEVTSSEVKIKSTNLDIGVEITLPAKVEEKGVIAVPSTICNQFVGSLDNNSVITIEKNDEQNNVTLTTKTTKTTLNTYNHEDFPTPPFIDEKEGITLPVIDFIKGLKSVCYSSSVSSMKPELASVYIYPNNNYIIFVATDSFRLAEKKIRTKKNQDFPSLLIPYKNTAEIIKILEECIGDINIQISKNQISILHNNIHITSRIVDGTFPDYSQFIPKNFLTETVALKQDLITTLKVANVFSDTYNKINFNINPTTKTFEIKTKNTNIGEHTNTLQTTLSGDIVNLNFNHRYITDCFQSIDTDSVGLYFNGANKPMVIKGISDDSFTYIVMPMNK